MLELTTPKIRRDQKVAAEFRPAKLEPWLERLPKDDREARAKWLHKALSTQNRVVIAPGDRLELMELYISPFMEVQASLLSEMRSISTVPLHPHYRSKLEGMLHMLDAMAAGYKIAVLDLAILRRGRNRRANLALALQRAACFLGQFIVAACEIYLRPSGGAWRELHQLYVCAEEHGLLTTGVAPVDGGSGASNVLDTYLQVLLVGASDPLSLLPGEARRLYELAPSWSPLLRFVDSTGRSAQPGHFRVSLKSDLPPLPLSKTARPPGEDARVLRTLEVARSMHEALMQVNESDDRGAAASAPEAVGTRDAELLRRAGRVLGEVNIKRNSNRVEVDQLLEFIAGFESVCGACDGRRASLAAVPDAEPVDDTGAASGRNGEQFIDLAEPMFEPTDSPVPRPAAPPDREQALVRIDNQSAGGVCLVIPRSTDVRLKVGEIGACRFPGSGRWQPGVVRWMRVTSREIRFGIQFLGPVAKSVETVREDGVAAAAPDATATKGTAIWLPENPALKQPGSIVLPRKPGPPPTRLWIRDSDAAPLEIRVLGRLERTGAYEQLLVSVESPVRELQSSLSS